MHVHMLVSKLVCTHASLRRPFAGDLFRTTTFLFAIASIAPSVHLGYR